MSSFSSLFRWPSFLINLHGALKAWLYFGLTTICLFILASNSITRGLAVIWSDCGNVWQWIWSRCVLGTGASEAMIFIGGASLLHIVTYWCHSLLLAWFDCSEGDHILTRYKIQPGKNAPVEHQKLVSCVIQVLINQFFVALPMNALCYPLAVRMGVGISSELPTFAQACSHMAVFLVVEELLFYYLHRLMHRPPLYGMVHKRHHEWTAPIAIATNYCHPVEHALCNLLPVMIGPLLCGSHCAVIWMWQTIATVNSINTHSGYHLPLMPSPEAHDFHHLRFNVNYGVMGVLDWLHGTDHAFKQSKQFRRHKTYFSLDPEQFEADARLGDVTQTTQVVAPCKPSQSHGFSECKCATDDVEDEVKSSKLVGL